MSRDPVIPEAYTVFFLYVLLLLSCRSHIDVVTSPAPPEGVRVGGCYSFVYAIYVCRPKGLRRFGRSIDHFGLESGLVFEGTTGVYEGICRFNSK